MLVVPLAGECFFYVFGFCGVDILEMDHLETRACALLAVVSGVNL